MSSPTKILIRRKKTIKFGIHITSAGSNKLIKEDSVASLAGTAASSANSLIAECKDLLLEAS